MDRGAGVSVEQLQQETRQTATVLTEKITVHKDETEKNLQQIIRSVSDLTQSAAENDDAVREEWRLSR